jgi:hypothetical protein
MGSIGVDSLVGPEHLDGDVCGHRPDGNGLFGVFESCGIRVVTKRLRDPLRDQEEVANHADGQQNIERTAGEIDPELFIDARAKRRMSTTARYRRLPMGNFDE